MAPREGTEAARALVCAPPSRSERRDDPLRQATRERDVGMLVEVAHDLRSPLTAILTLAELLQSGQSGQVNDRQRRQLGLMYSAALCLCATASDLIELARDGDRLAEHAPVRLSLREVLANLGAMVRPMVEVRGLEVKFESPEPDERMGFPRALSRVLLNLTTNAVKNTDRGVVTVAARAIDANRMEFSVSDTGRGITAEEQQHIFEPFRTGLSTERHHFSSAGLGLAISRTLVQAMGSDLRLESTPEQGSRFFFEVELPAA